LRKAVLSLAFLLLFTGSGSAADSRFVPAALDELKSDIQAILQEDNIPGASIALVSRDEVIWAGGVGKADLAGGRDVTADTLFRVGSISKAFSALAVLTLVEQGRIDLDTPVRLAAPEVEFTNPWSGSNPVTLAMVMEHTAGFDDIHVREYAKVDDPDITLQEGLAYHPHSRTSRWPPGTFMSYANSGPPIAAYVLEKVTGQSFEDYTRDRVFDVLGMQYSTFLYPEEPRRLARGYQEDGITEAPYDHIIIRPSGALNSSAAEMARFLRMMLNRGTLDGVRFLREETIERMETPTTNLVANAGYTFGYGLGNYAEIFNGHRFFGHDGGITGFVSSARYSPELGVGFFVSINKPSGGLNDISERIAQLLTEGAELPEPPQYQAEPWELEAVAGYYRLYTPRADLASFITRLLMNRRISLEDGKLYSKSLLGGSKHEMMPVAAGAYRYEDHTVDTRYVLSDGDGRIFALWPLGGNFIKTPGAWVMFQMAAAAIALMLMLSSILFALVWLPARVFGKMRTLPVKPVLVPLLAVLALLAAVPLPFMVSSDVVGAMGNRTAASMTAFMGTLVFAALTFYSLFTSVRARHGRRWLRIHSAAVALACLATLFYLAAHGIIGIRTWLY
jgi:CubicO group peptidase (beta-lactamase class C family)